FIIFQNVISQKERAPRHALLFFLILNFVFPLILHGLPMRSNLFQDLTPHPARLADAKQLVLASYSSC
ncbi:MAG: hypothetical protein IJ756_02640, partial [Paludibacteraceae bacterium]|nr:hypothetical protein [Paludibacteraceae bacterium]